MHNIRRTGKDPLTYIPELTRFEKENRRHFLETSRKMANEGNQNADTRVLLDTSMPGLGGARQSITRPTIEANNFEIKPALLQMIQSTVQFYGMLNEDPNDHIANFLEICDTLKYNGVTNDALRLRLFPFTLKDKAKAWLKSQPPGSFTNWNDLARAFLAKYFPPSKTAKVVKELTSFQQFEHESLSEAWERFTELQRSCPHHGLPKDVLIRTFYNGVTSATRDSIDAKAGGFLMRKTVDEAAQLLDRMALDNCLWSSERVYLQKQME